MIKVFCTALKECIVQQIKTSVYIEYNNEEDTITITIHSYLKPYRYTLPNITNLIVKGTEPKYLSVDVLKGYKKYVLKYFFK